MDLVPGLKATGVGPLPKDWTVERLVDVGPIITGNTPPPGVAGNYGNQFPFVGPGDVGFGRNIKQAAKALSARGFAVARRLPAKSVLFVCIGSTIGKCGLADVALATNQQINAIVPRAGFLSEYVYYALSFRAPAVRALAGEQAVPLVNKAQFGETELAFPPTFSEQATIAEVLSDADGLIESIEDLISKKRLVRQGLMQELLTGRRRMQGFDGEWCESSLGSIAQFLPGEYLPKSLYRDGPFCVYGAGSIMGFHQQPNIADAITIVGRVGTIGRPRFAPNGAWVNNNAGAIRARPGQADPRFVHLLLETVDFSTVSAVTAQPFLVVKGLLEKSFRVPPVDEQSSIANVLFDLEHEVDALLAKAEKARKLKEGMMQQLLTGRIRLV